MNRSNLHGLPDAIVNAVINDPYSGGGDISVTKLIDSPQRRVLRKKYDDVIVEDITRSFFSLLGQGVHAILERSEKEGIVEQRLFADVGGWKLSGAFDRLDLREKSLDDYKVTSVYNTGPKPEWERQLNILRWLAVKNGYDVAKLRIIALYRDWSESAKERKADYPQVPIAAIDIPVWDIQETERYIEERIALHQRAEAGEQIECTDEDRWYSQTTYALKKKGLKRAVKIYTSKEDAGDIPEGMVLEERKGTFRRCEKYCEVAPFCPQWTGSNDGEEVSDAEW